MPKKQPAGAKDRYFSHSQIQLFDRCPKWYYSRYKLGLQNKATPPMLFGSVVHKALETIHNLAKKRPVELEDCQVIWDDIFSGKIPIYRWLDKERTKQEQITINIPAQFYKDGLIGLKSYTERNLTEVLNLFKSELNMNVKVGDFNLMCIVDRLDVYPDKLRIIEFKSGRKIPSRVELKENLQLDIEAYAVRKSFGTQQKIETAYFSFLSGAMIIIEKGEEDIDATGKYLERICNQIENTKAWEPRLNDYCHECPVSSDCSLYREHMAKHLEVENFNTILAGDGVNIGKLYQDTNTRLKLLEERKSLLKGVLELSVLNLGGELPTPEGIWKMTQIHKKSYTVEEHDESQLRFFKAGKGKE